MSDVDAFAALADPTRRSILEILSRGERSATGIADQFEFVAQTISQHLKVLRGAHLVRMTREAQRRIYAIDRDGLAPVRAWLHGIDP